MIFLPCKRLFGKTKKSKPIDPPSGRRPRLDGATDGPFKPSLWLIFVGAIRKPTTIEKRAVLHVKQAHSFIQRLVQPFCLATFVGLLQYKMKVLASLRVN